MRRSLERRLNFWKKADLGGHVQRKEERRRGGRERYSYCWEWCHSEGSGGVSKLGNRG